MLCVQFQEFKRFLHFSLVNSHIYMYVCIYVCMYVWLFQESVLQFNISSQEFLFQESVLQFNISSQEFLKSFCKSIGYNAPCSLLVSQC